MTNDPVTLEWGDCDLLYEGGAVRLVRRGSVEILRAVYAAVRDPDWRTVPYSVVREDVTEGDDGFRILSERVYADGRGIQVRALCEIVGAADGALTFAFDGTALASFYANRVGLCVLHPTKECAGQECVLMHTDGTSERARFPDQISPHQPFLNLRGMEWRPAPGIVAAVTMTGETFECEDQRNWTDASFKTYGTPLALPFPAAFEKGARWQQTVTLRVETTGPRPASRPEVVTISTLPGPARPLPPIGVSLASGPMSNDAELLRCLPLCHLRAELHFAGEWRGQWAQAREVSRQLGLPLHLALFLTANAETECAALCADWSSASVQAILLSQSGAKTTPPALTQTVLPRLRASLPNAQIGVGTDAYFAEVNRQTLDGGDFLAFCATPQVHADDNRTVLENAAALADVVTSARRLAAGRAVHMSPLTLARRRNPDATGPAVPMPPDPRLAIAFGAAWLLASVSHLTNADSVTVCETSGANGLIENGQARPLYHVLRALQGNVWPCAVSDPERVACLRLRHEGKITLLLANLTAHSVTVCGAVSRVLPPYGFVRHEEET